VIFDMPFVARFNGSSQRNPEIRERMAWATTPVLVREVDPADLELAITSGRGHQIHALGGMLWAAVGESDVGMRPLDIQRLTKDPKVLRNLAARLNPSRFMDNHANFYLDYGHLSGMPKPSFVRDSEEGATAGRLRDYAAENMLVAGDALMVRVHEPSHCVLPQFSRFEPSLQRPTSLYVRVETPPLVPWGAERFQRGFHFDLCSLKEARSIGGRVQNDFGDLPVVVEKRHAMSMTFHRPFTPEEDMTRRSILSFAESFGVHTRLLGNAARTAAAPFARLRELMHAPCGCKCEADFCEMMELIGSVDHLVGRDMEIVVGWLSEMWAERPVSVAEVEFSALTA
jgi:hypothetical protein